MNISQLIKSNTGQDGKASESEAVTYVVNEKTQEKVLKSNKIDQKDIKKYSYNLSLSNK